jgi:hypothetical protein
MVGENINTIEENTEGPPDGTKFGLVVSAEET